MNNEKSSATLIWVKIYTCSIHCDIFVKAFKKEKKCDNCMESGFRRQVVTANEKDIKVSLHLKEEKE